jgi:hypothetical protein
MHCTLHHGATGRVAVGTHGVQQRAQHTGAPAAPTRHAPLCCLRLLVRRHARVDAVRCINKLAQPLALLLLALLAQLAVVPVAFEDD